MYFGIIIIHRQNATFYKILHYAVHVLFLSCFQFFGFVSAVLLVVDAVLVFKKVKA